MTPSAVPRSVVAARVVVGTLGGLLILVAGAVSLLFLVLGSSCDESGHTGKCAGEMAMALSPIAAVLPTAVAAIVVVGRSRQAGVAWGWGLGLLAAGLAIPVVEFVLVAY
ncbi:hypothetical protein [Amycolatopsis sp. PS_44_ISF1]|uniref:hypothetical protein n=1 Tax=Amycolatopsis sp. PS_44_ISF1 TaxID=2974917 RepID=UPI0028DDD23A|nr:hypothetical protein [Amycolatopsis sp. PS_44_ISF1]MDT8911100.1 hypothetical protein [Amycolatopsis sp. PS_44_ISF1]